MPRRLIPTDREGKILMAGMLVCMLLVGVLVWVLLAIPRSAHGSERTPYGRLAPLRLSDRQFIDESVSLDKFGIYSLHYMELRWQRMCKGPARYDAMREAADLNHTNPCG
jgi:hypothetical protein